MVVGEYSPLLVDWQITTGFQNGEVFAGKRPASERVDIAILGLLCERSGCLVSLELGEGRLLRTILVLIHVSQVRVILWVASVHLLALGS